MAKRKARNNEGTLEKKGKWFYVRYVDHDGKRKRKNTHETDKRKAEAFRLKFMTEKRLVQDIGNKKARLHHVQAQLQAELDESKSELMDMRKVLVKDIYTRLFDDDEGKRFCPKVSEYARDVYNRFCVKFAEWIDGKIKNSTLDMVTREMAGEWLQTFLYANKKDMHKRALTHLRAVYNCYVKMGNVFDNPFSGFEYAKHIPHTSKRQLDDDEMARLMNTLKDEPDEIRALFVLTSETGQRYGDICNLRWTSIKTRTASGTKSYWLEFAPSKTKRHGITVDEPLTETAVNVLKEIKEKKLDGEFVLPTMAKEYAIRNGVSLLPRLLSVFDKAGINRKNAEGKTVVGMHSLRHGFVSRMAINGVPLTTVMSMVGHTREKMTEHYTHTSDEAKLKAIASCSSNNGGMVGIEISKATMEMINALKGDMGIDAFLSQAMAEIKKQREVIYV